MAMKAKVDDNPRTNDKHPVDDLGMAWWILALNTLAFMVCFAVWMMNGVLVTFLVDNGVYRWTPAERAG